MFGLLFFKKIQKHWFVVLLKNQLKSCGSSKVQHISLAQKVSKRNHRTGNWSMFFLHLSFYQTGAFEVPSIFEPSAIADLGSLRGTCRQMNSLSLRLPAPGSQIDPLLLGTNYGHLLNGCSPLRTGAAQHKIYTWLRNPLHMPTWLLAKQYDVSFGFNGIPSRYLVRKLPSYGE